MLTSSLLSFSKTRPNMTPARQPNMCAQTLTFTFSFSLWQVVLVWKTAWTSRLQTKKLNWPHRARLNWRGCNRCQRGQRRWQQRVEAFGVTSHRRRALPSPICTSVEIVFARCLLKIVGHQPAKSFVCKRHAKWNCWHFFANYLHKHCLGFTL